MPARDNRYSQVATDGSGDKIYARTYGEVDYDEKTKEALQDLLAERDLPVSGNKDELIARLKDY